MMTHIVTTRLEESVRCLRADLRCADTIRIGLILGSGLGGFVDTLPERQGIPYAEIAGFPQITGPSIDGHARALVASTISPGCTVACLQGRFHFYEGYSLPEVVHPVRVLRQLGARILIVTNAAGGIHPTFRAGDLMLITDHLNLMGVNPLMGPNLETLGPRFPDLTEAYSPMLTKLAQQVAGVAGIPLQEGVYAALSGPTYETPAEIRMLRTLGADAVGMSTVPEVIAANHMGMQVLGISCITNLAAGISLERLSHDEVLATGKRVQQRFSTLLTGILDRLAVADGVVSEPAAGRDERA